MKDIILILIKFYQKIISPDHGIFRRPYHGCRFYPSCSEYSYQAIKKYGVKKGMLFTVKRILRCQPWNDGGVDLVK
ncbi:MAG: membrane protein insertion efficiency factor YidD [Candidatus Nanoarchaeia archaeon]